MKFTMDYDNEFEPAYDDSCTAESSYDDVYEVADKQLQTSPKASSHSSGGRYDAYMAKTIDKSGVNTTVCKDESEVVASN